MSNIKELGTEIEMLQNKIEKVNKINKIKKREK